MKVKINRTLQETKQNVATRYFIDVDAYVIDRLVTRNGLVIWQLRGRAQNPSPENQREYIFWFDEYNEPVAFVGSISSFAMSWYSPEGTEKIYVADNKHKYDIAYCIMHKFDNIVRVIERTEEDFSNAMMYLIRAGIDRYNRLHQSEE